MKNLKWVGALVLFLTLVACGGGGGSPGKGPGDGDGLPDNTPLPIALYTTAPDTLTIEVGSSRQFTIGGGKSPYVAVSDNAAIAISGVSGDQLTLGGVADGSAKVVIRDALGGSVNVNVNVSKGVVRPLFTTATPNTTITPGMTGVQTYRVGGGASPYTATSSNPSVVAADLLGDSLRITGLASGSARVAIMDSLGAVVNIEFTVSTVSNLPLFSTAPPSVTVGIGSSPAYNVGGGTGPYTATSSNAAVATVSLVGNSLTVNGLVAGTANVVVRDSAGSSITIEVVVEMTALAVTPNGATAIIGDVLIATITGGKPPFRASVGNLLVADATVQNANELRIALKQVGGTIVTVLDADNQSVPYSLISNAATPGIRFSPNAVRVSEFDTQPIFLNVFGAAPGVMNVFSSDVTLFSATIDGQVVTLNTGSSGNRCVSDERNVTITVVDSTRAVGVAVVTIEDNRVTCP